jgi:GDPmannose 4,6-dehydratase
MQLVGDARSAYAVLNWRPLLGFRELVISMVDADLAAEKSAFPTRGPI